MDTEKTLREGGITVIKRESQDNIHTVTIRCPAQKLHRLLDRLRAIGDVKDSPAAAEKTDGDLRVTIRIVPR